MPLKDILRNGVVEESVSEDEGQSLLGNSLFGSVINGQQYTHLTSRPNSTPEAIPPRRTMSAQEASRIQQQLLVPQKGQGELIPPPSGQQNNLVGLIGKVTSYPAAIPVTLADTAARKLGVVKSPQELFGADVVRLDGQIQATNKAQQIVNSPDSRSYIEMLAKQITSTWGPIRNATANDAVPQFKQPTTIERRLAAELAPQINNTETADHSLQQMRDKIGALNQQIVETHLRQTFSDEELRRSAEEIESLIESNNGKLEIYHLPPLNLLAAAVLADPSLLPIAISATLWNNELKRRGITVVLQQNELTQQSELQVLIGGPGVGVEPLPANAIPSWNQPLAQEVASDSNWGRSLFRFWSPNLKKLFRFKFREVFDKTTPIVEAGTLTLTNPGDASIKVKLPILVTRKPEVKSSLGGGQSLQDAATIVKQAHHLLERSKQITEQRRVQNHLPQEIPQSYISPPENSEESLRRAYDDAKNLLLSEGIRPSIVEDLAKTYAESLQGIDTVGQGVEINVDHLFSPPVIKETPDPKTVLLERIMKLSHELQNPNLTNISRQALNQRRHDLIQKLRQYK